MNCKIDECNRPHYARGLCSLHYQRWFNHGDPLYAKPLRKCKVEGCIRPVEARGLCNTHYRRWYRHNRIGATPCSIEGCEKPVEARGWCQMHYWRWRTHGDPLINLKPRHHKSETQAYRTWQHMKSRCLNPKTVRYKNYGGRGISVCDRWQDFKNFYADMGDRPPGLQIDRIDNDGNYEPGNCQWVTPKENSNNRRRLTRRVA